MCSLGEKYIIATGSYLKDDKMHETTERYDLMRERWSELPSLTTGRSFHSSCTFEIRYAFVFCGLRHETHQVEEKEDGGLTIIKEVQSWKVTNTIERLDCDNTYQGWSQVEIAQPCHLTARRFPGVVQWDAEEIIILGGMSDKQLRARYFFNVFQGTIRRETAHASDPQICPRNRPVIFGVNQKLIAIDFTEPLIY